jgi:acetyltransferase-like isoleucine patch superfamily enzyme
MSEMHEHDGAQTAPTHESFDWLHRGVSKPLHFLIYLEMPNKHRAPIMAMLARTLLRGGHAVTIACEPQIAYRFGANPQIYVENNTKHIDAHFGGSLRSCVFTLSTFTDDSVEGLEASNLRRSQLLGALISEKRPDRVVVWSGNFHYQEGTLAALRDCGLGTKILFAEVAWFSQREYIYLDGKGVNAFSTLPGQVYPPLTAHKRSRLEAWRARYSVKRLGTTPALAARAPTIFVPLQIDTDTSIVMSSPFKSMREFIGFLERWIPPHYEVVVKLHPKATYPYIVTSGRDNFRIVAGGAIEQYMAMADAVVGINSTVLLEAAALGKRTIAFGTGLFSGTGALLEAKPDSDAGVLQEAMDKQALESLLYHLVFERQISLEALEREDYAHLATRMPLRDIFDARSIPAEALVVQALEGKSMIKVGKSKVAKTACLDVERGGQIIIGDDCEVRHHAVLEVSGRYDGSIEIGNHSVIGIGNWLQGSGRIRIGDNVIIGPYVAIVSTNHTYQDVDTPVAKQPLQTGEVVIEDDVWIGAHCTITQNVRIGAHSIIGANSFVNKDVPPYSIVGGAPAKLLKSRK